MAKQVTVLGLAGSVLRGVRLDEAGEALVRGAEEAWPLVEAPAEGDADGAGEAEPAEVDATAEVVVEDRPLVRAFRSAAAAFGTREFVLSVPLSRLLVKAVRLPAEARDDLLGAAQLELDGISPFPDEALTPGVEVVAETDTEIFAIFAALPAAPSEDISEALASAKVHVTRTDATALLPARSLRRGRRTRLPSASSRISCTIGARHSPRSVSKRIAAIAHRYAAAMARSFQKLT